MDIEQKIKDLRRFDQAYERGKPLIPDEQYDALKRELERIAPNHEYFKTVGATVPGEKIDLPYPMGSLNQIYEGDIYKWIKKYGLENEDIIITDKLDGVSVLLIYEKDGDGDGDGKCALKKAYTRGDGFKGEDITRHVCEIPSLPKEILVDDYVAIRAEIIMQNSIFNQNYKDKYKNARNMVAGLLNRKEPEKKYLKDVDVVAYEVIDANNMQSTKEDTLFWLNLQKFITPNIKKMVGSSLDDNTLSNHLRKTKENSVYELDGIVLTVQDYSNFENVSKSSSLNPEHSVKFKVLDEDSVVETVVEDVIWKISKTGFYKPRVKIKPVELFGSTVTYATGFNAKFISENGIGKGSKIKITKAGSVIPYIVEITKHVDPKMPNGDWHWDENGVEAVIDNSTEQVFMEVVHFFKTIEMENAQETSLKKVIEHEKLENKDFETIVFEIVSLMGAEWKRILGENGIKAHDSLHKKLSTIKPEKLLGATPFFGRGFGVRKAKKILDQMSYEDFLNASIQDIQELEGFDITSEAIYNGIEKYKEFFNLIEFAVEFEECEDADQTLEGEKIVMTGFRDKQLQDAIQNRGGKVTTSVSKNTTMVVAQDVNSNSGKVKKAKELNIPVISQRDFNFRYIQ
jgi:NAD-dependent DNA ligase